MIALEVGLPSIQYKGVAPDLRIDDVHVWNIPLDRPTWSAGNLHEYLSEDERVRARRFVFERDREHFIAARSCLRLILAHYLECGPRNVQFGYGLHGKPYLLNQITGSPISFNLSHTRGKAICAVALSRQVGIDIEQIRPEVDILGIARTTFSPGEYVRLVALPPGQRIDAFYACWTRKEAFIKALGAGLSYPLDAFDVSFEPNSPTLLLRSAEGEAERQRWVLREIDAGVGYVAAVVVEQPLRDVQLIELG